MLLGRYEVIRRIGAGGFGEVLLARSIGAEGFERIVALKRLKGELAHQHLKGIINEARIGGLLNHPNIVQVLEFIRVEKRGATVPDYLLVMEFVDGIAVQDILELERISPHLLTPSHAIDIGIQVCEGLHYAHVARAVNDQPLKLIHRDIKPSNLMINKSGTVKIMDFGVAKSASNMGNSTTGSIKGTLRYLSPEQAEGRKEIGHGSDLFSLGLVLCEMIIGRSVYDAEQEHLVLLQALQAQTADALKEVEAKAPALAPILSRCLVPEPNKRFRTAEELMYALRSVSSLFPIHHGLADLVTRALTTRSQVIDSSDGITETSFSIELRRHNQNGTTFKWEVISSESFPRKAYESAKTEQRKIVSLWNGEGSDPGKTPAPERGWEWEWPTDGFEEEKIDPSLDGVEGTDGVEGADASECDVAADQEESSSSTDRSEPSPAALPASLPQSSQERAEPASRPKLYPGDPSVVRRPTPTSPDLPRLQLVESTGGSLFFQFLLGLFVGAALVGLGVLIGLRMGKLPW